MPFNLLWEAHPGYYHSWSHGLMFRLNLAEQHSVEPDKVIPSVLVSGVRYRSKSGEQLLNVHPYLYTAVSVSDAIVRVRHEGFRTKANLFDRPGDEPRIEAPATWCGKQFTLIPGDLKYDIYVADRVSARQAGAPTPPLVPGYAWVRRSDLNRDYFQENPVTLFGLDTPEDLHFRVLGQAPLIQYANELNVWARSKRGHDHPDVNL